MKAIGLVILGSLISLSGCSPVVYSSVGQNVPLFKQKGEVSAAASLASTDDGAGIGLQVAGAADSSLAIISSFYALSGGGEFDDDWKGHGSYFELGAGKFDRLDLRNKFSYEVLAGIGFGGIKNSKEFSTVNVSFVKPFIQPSLGVSGVWFDFAITPRIAYVSYTRHDVQISDPTMQQEFEDFFSKRKNTFVLEPGLTMRFGYKRLKAQLQFCGTTFSTLPEASPAINTSFLSLGAHYVVTNRFRKKTE